MCIPAVSHGARIWCTTIRCFFVRFQYEQSKWTRTHLHKTFVTPFICSKAASKRCARWLGGVRHTCIFISFHNRCARSQATDGTFSICGEKLRGKMALQMRVCTCQAISSRRKHNLEDRQLPADSACVDRDRDLSLPPSCYQPVSLTMNYSASSFQVNERNQQFTPIQF